MPEIALGGVDQIGMEGQSVEVPRPVRELLDAAELVTGVSGMGGRIGEVLLGRREMQPQRLLRRPQLVGGEKPLDDGEPVIAHLVEIGVRDPHRPAS